MSIRFLAQGNNGLSLTGFKPMRLAILGFLVRRVNHSTTPPLCREALRENTRRIQCLVFTYAYFHFKTWWSFSAKVFQQRLSCLLPNRRVENRFVVRASVRLFVRACFPCRNYLA